MSKTSVKYLLCLAVILPILFVAPATFASPVDTAFGLTCSNTELSFNQPSFSYNFSVPVLQRLERRDWEECERVREHCERRCRWEEGRRYECMERCQNEHECGHHHWNY